jgi:hypothetical protein
VSVSDELNTEFNDRSPIGLDLRYLCHDVRLGPAFVGS